MPMDLNEQKQQFSLAYIRVIAADVGCKVTVPESDTDSIDDVLMASFGR